MCQVVLDFCQRNLISTARYDPAHHWCWFSVVCGVSLDHRFKKTVAVFRLHFQEDVCWDFFKLLNCEVLHPVQTANMTFRYGSQHRLPEIQTKDKCDTNRDFEFGWLEQFFENYHGSQCEWGT